MKKRTFQVLSVVCAAAFTSGVALAQQRFEGAGKGTVVTPAPFVGTPLLDSFLVRFGPPLDQPSGADHHLKALEVRPQRPEPSNLTVTYADKNADDSYAYVVSFHSRGVAGPEAGSTEEILCAIQCSLPLARPSPDHVFVLRGFKLYVDDGDHHVERLALFEADGVLTVGWEHVGGGFLGLGPTVFLFGFQVDYVYLPPAAVREVGELWGRAQASATGNIPAGASVLRGFDFRFTNGDHHVREIGVQTPDDGRVEVFFNDKNSDDEFIWSVRWATLAPAVPAPVAR